MAVAPLSFVPYDVVQKHSKIRTISALSSRPKTFDNLQSITTREYRELKPLVRTQPDLFYTQHSTAFHRSPHQETLFRRALPESPASRLTSINRLATRLGPLFPFRHYVSATHKTSAYCTTALHIDHPFTSFFTTPLLPTSTSTIRHTTTAV